jgi:hypothetical protein
MEHEDSKHDADCHCEKCEAKKAEQFGTTKVVKSDVEENLKKLSSERDQKKETQSSVARERGNVKVEPILPPTNDANNTD